MGTARFKVSELAASPGFTLGQSRAKAMSTDQFERFTTISEITIDLFTTFLAVMASFGLYSLFHLGKQLYYSPEKVALGAVAFAFLFVYLLERDGTYTPAISLLRIRETERILRVTLTAFGLVFPATFFLSHLFSRYVLLTAIFAVPTMLILEKQLASRVIRNLHTRGYGIQNVLIYGAGATGRRMFSALIRSPKLGLRPVLMIDDNPALEGQSVFADGYRREHSLSVRSEPLTRELFLSQGVGLVLVGIPSIARERLDSIAVEAAAANCNVAFVPELSRVKDSSTSYADFDGLLVASLNGSSSRPAYEIAKATVDRMGALLLILLTLPAWLVIAALIRLDSKGPVFFYQTRIGRRGVPFRMFKFRSMRVDAPKYGYHPSGTFDPRVTRVGRWLRRSSLDELPQLLNVLLGTMSLVGPRPEMPFIAEKYTPFEQQRLAVTPGITGLWQISADRAFMIHENLQYDLYYIHNRNFFMDIALLVHTLMFAMRGV